MKTPNQAILEHLTFAPEGQLSETLRKEAASIDPNDPAAIKAYFHKVFSLCECERSRFVAALVDPTFTDLPGYSEPKNIDKK